MNKTSESKKILHVIHGAFVINHFFGNQFLYFSKKGYEFTVACTNSKELHKSSKANGFKVFPISILRTIDPLQDIISIYKLYKFIRIEEFDAVVAHSPKGGLIGMTASFFAKTPHRIFFRHGLVYETSKTLKKAMLMSIEKITGFFAHKVVNVSPSVLEKAIIDKLNNPKKNILLGKGTCSGIDIKKFIPSSKESQKIVIGYVGRLSIDKGIIELIEAWNLLLKENINIELLLVGPIDERDPLPEKTLEIIKNNVTITHTGYVEDTTIYYQKMDIFILPSYREGFGMVVLEASAVELPVITTRKTGCINSIIEDVTGIYTDITAKDIKTKIQYYIDNKEIRIQHGINGRMFVENNFTEQILFDEIERKIFFDL